VRAVEVSCDDAGATVHLLAYDTGGAWAALEARLAAVRAARVSRLRKMAARLATRGVTVDVEALITRADGRAVGRPDLARAMVAQGVVRTMKEAFSRHLYDGGPVDVPHEGLSVADALATATAAGARVSLAHPHLYGDRTIPMLRRYRDAGLGGLETHYGHYDAGERARWREVARKHALVETGGSDFHAPGDPEPGVDVPDEVGAALVTWLGVA
jgi:predicted metal-dependent phosphoesterase TrpH